MLSENGIDRCCLNGVEEKPGTTAHQLWQSFLVQQTSLTPTLKARMPNGLFVQKANLSSVQACIQLHRVKCCTEQSVWCTVPLKQMLLNQ